MVNIYKYRVPKTGTFAMQLPIGARVIHFGANQEELQLWALVNPNAPPEERIFRMLCTGEDCHLGADHLQHVNTGIFNDGKLVLHLFEVVGVVARAGEPGTEEMVWEWRFHDAESAWRCGPYMVDRFNGAFFNGQMITGCGHCGTLEAARDACFVHFQKGEEAAGKRGEDLWQCPNCGMTSDGAATSDGKTRTWLCAYCGASVECS